MNASISKIDPSLTWEKLQHSVESQYFDRKSAKIQPKDLARHISAMANASGGVLVVGIEDKSREITGITDAQENTLRQVPFDFFQKVPELEVETITSEDGKKVFLYHISPMPDDVIKCKDGEAYLRVGDSSRKLNSEQLLELEYSKGIRSYESQILKDASLEDLDHDLIEEYCNILELNVSSPLDILKARGLIKQKDGNW